MAKANSKAAPAARNSAKTRSTKDRASVVFDAETAGLYRSIVAKLARDLSAHATPELFGEWIGNLSDIVPNVPGPKLHDEKREFGRMLWAEIEPRLQALTEEADVPPLPASPAPRLMVDIHTKDPAQFATNYFAGLVKDPASVELGGYLDDLNQLDGDDPAQAFAEALQEHLVGLVCQVKGIGVTVHVEAFNEATVRLGELRALLDLLGSGAGTGDLDPTGLQEHTLQSAALMALRLTNEAYDLLTAPYEEHEQSEEGRTA